MTHKITLVPKPLNRGDKLIYVDGVVWGSVIMNRHGARGASYNFSVPGHGLIYRNGSDAWNRTAVQVNSDTKARRRCPPGTVLAPFADRLMDTIRELIATGALRHPDAVRQEAEAAAEKERAEKEEHKEKQDREWSDRAKYAIATASLSNLPDDEWRRLVANIVEAMRWAQTQ